MAIRSTNANRPARQREPWMDDPNAIRDRRNTPPPPGPPGGGSVWDWSNQEWTDMPNLNPRRPWSRTNPDGTRTGDPNERIDHFPGSASGEWNPNRYRMDENGNWVPRPTGYGGIPLNDDGKPIYTPDPTRYPEYFAPGSGRADTAEETRAYEEKKRQALAQDPEYVAAMQAAGQLSGPAALKARFAAEVAAKQRAQKQRYMTDYGMSEDTYDNRFNTSWPVPRSPSGNYQYGPGRPGPTPPGVRPPAATGPTGAPPASRQALPPPQNPMIQGYVQGPGGFGQFNPMQSKSGMGQNPMSGPAMSTGNPMVSNGSDLQRNLDIAAQYGGGNPFGMAGGDMSRFTPNSNPFGGMPSNLSGNWGLWGGGVTPVGLSLSNRGGFNPMMGGMGMGGMGYGGYGGYNPTAQGMNPFAALMGGYY